MKQILSLLSVTGATQVFEDGSEADTDALVKAGVPGISAITDMQHYFDWHHSVDDSIDKVDPFYLQKYAASMAALVYVLADMQESIRDIAQK